MRASIVAVGARARERERELRVPRAIVIFPPTTDSFRVQRLSTLATWFEVAVARWLVGGAGSGSGD